MAATSQVSMSYPKPRDSQTKFVKILRTDTTAFQGAMLPRDAVITGLYVIGQAVCNASVGSGFINLGNTTTANEYIASYDVCTTATGYGYNPAGAKADGATLGERLTADTPIYAKFVEVSTSSSSGGPWYVKIEYAVLSSGETIQL